MANKLIPELQEATDFVSETTFLVVDTNVQTFKLKASNLYRIARTPIQILLTNAAVPIVPGTVYVAKAGGIPFAMPTAPQIGDRFEIKDALGLFNSNPCTITPYLTGLIEELNAPYVLTAQFGNFKFFFDGVSWRKG